MLQDSRYGDGRLINGFTLIEMMVVIGIIAILGVIAMPGLKKIYSDYKIRETVNTIDTLASSMRSCYLVFNETIPIDTGSAWGVDPRMFPFVLGGGEENKENTFHRYSGRYHLGTQYYLIEHLYKKLHFHPGWFTLFIDPTKSLGYLNPWCAMGDFSFQFSSRNVNPADYNEFLWRLEKKGYIIEEGANYNLKVYLPERKNDYTSIAGSPYMLWFQ